LSVGKGASIIAGFQGSWVFGRHFDHRLFLCNERGRRGGRSFSFFLFYFLFCEIEGNDDLSEIGVLPLLVTRQAGMRAAWRSTPPWRTEELG